MKINKLFLGLAAIAIGALTSCNTDVEGVIYNSPTENISFTSAEPATISTDQESVTVTVRITRADTKSAYTAHYTTEASDEGIFSDDCNGVVNFAQGQGTAIVNVTAANLEKGMDYTYTMTLSEADVAQADKTLDNQIVQTVIKIHSDYNWVDAGSCTFVDYCFSSSGAAAREVPILFAEGTNLYRIVTPYQAVYGSSDDSIPEDNNIEFTLDSDGEISFEDGFLDTLGDWGDGVVGIYYNAAKYPDYCNVARDGNIFTVKHLVAEGDNLYTGWEGPGLFMFQWDGYPNAE